MNGDQETRERLLKEAERLFGERGFKRTTVREICRAARANVAAVNYHFGDKLGLYRDVLQTAIDLMCETTELARNAGRGELPQEQLRRFILIFLQRVLTPGHETVQRLIHREMHDPTPALDAIAEQALRPRIEYLSGVVARMIGCDPSEDVVLRSVASIQMQFMAYLRNPLVPGQRDVAARLGLRFDPTPAAIEAAAQHIATFSIAGIQAVGRTKTAGSAVLTSDS